MAGPSTENRVIEEIFSRFLPEVCWKHVYRGELQRSYEVVDQGEHAYCVWTFYNDERVRLKALVHKDDPYSYMSIRLEPVCDDFEAWQADAIMRCDAGPDIWSRSEAQQPDLFNQYAMKANTTKANVTTTTVLAKADQTPAK